MLPVFEISSDLKIFCTLAYIACLLYPYIHHSIDSTESMIHISINQSIKSKFNVTCIKATSLGRLI